MEEQVEGNLFVKMGQADYEFLPRFVSESL